MPVEAIRNKTPRQLHTDVDDFAARYVQDWDRWLKADADVRPELFARILGKWQATRPERMRRLKTEAQHPGPSLNDLLKEAEEPLRVLAGLSVSTIAERTPAQNEALHKLWSTFSRLRQSDKPTCVGITKAILLLTEGRIGPAFDARVRSKLGVARPTACSEWVKILEDIAEDIAAFEHAHGALNRVVPTRFADLAYGRLYDMALGPRAREATKETS